MAGNDGGLAQHFVLEVCIAIFTHNILLMINKSVVLFGATFKVNPFLRSVYGHSCEIVKDNGLIQNLKG